MIHLKCEHSIGPWIETSVIHGSVPPSSHHAATSKLTVIISLGDLCSSWAISRDAVILKELMGDENKVGDACKGTNGVGADGSEEDAIGAVDW